MKCGVITAEPPVPFILELNLCCFHACTPVKRLQALSGGRWGAPAAPPRSFGETGGGLGIADPSPENGLSGV